MPWDVTGGVGGTETRGAGTATPARYVTDRGMATSPWHARSSRRALRWLAAAGLAGLALSGCTESISVEWVDQPSVRVGMEQADLVARVRVPEHLNSQEVDGLPADRYRLAVVDAYGGATPEELTLIHPDPDAADWDPELSGAEVGDEAVAILHGEDSAVGSPDPGEAGVMIAGGEQGWLTITGASVSSLGWPYPSLTAEDWPTSEPATEPSGTWPLADVEALAREVNAARAESP